MAEFCPECWNQIHGVDDPQEAYVLSWDLELCEGCGAWKRVVVEKRNWYCLRYMINQIYRYCKNRR